MVAAVEAASLFEQPERPGIGDGVHPDKVKPPFPFLWTGFHSKEPSAFIFPSTDFRRQC
jgi:hypothetical protein